ncbi:hypothetical protein [Streptomyces lichenis]|uniref:hypothetical protein n=1 Tax=Streptomyces lichenis TaxID=2306967 RepID=UPI003557A0F0
MALVVAELASNAVLHGRVPGRDSALRLVYEEPSARLRTEVADTRGGRPAPRTDREEVQDGVGRVLAATAGTIGKC